MFLSGISSSKVHVFFSENSVEENYKIAIKDQYLKTAPEMSLCFFPPLEDVMSQREGHNYFFFFWKKRSGGLGEQGLSKRTS